MPTNWVSCPYCDMRFHVRRHSAGYNAVELHIGYVHPEHAGKTRYERVREQIARWHDRKRQIEQLYGWRCLACGRTEDQSRADGRGGITIDHVVPTAHDGDDDITNWQPLCGTCNGDKAALIVDYRPRAIVIALMAGQLGILPADAPPIIVPVAIEREPIEPCIVALVGRLRWCSLHEQPAGHVEREARSA